MNSHPTKAALSLAGLLVTFLGSTNALAANLLDNANFDQTADEYSAYNPITREWKAKDASDVALSGSMLVTNPKANMNSGAVRCVGAVEAGKSYDLAARIFVPSGQQADGSIGLFVTWYDGPSCGGNQLNGGNGAYANLATKDVWQGVRSLAKVAPVGTVSARIYINVYNKAGSTGPLSGYYDDIYFGPTLTADPPAITSSAPAAGEIGKGYVHTFTANGAPLVTFKADALPPGLTLTPSGLLAGTPTTKGSYPVEVTASNGVDAPVKQSFALSITGPEEDAGTSDATTPDAKDAGTTPGEETTAPDAGAPATSAAPSSAPAKSAAPAEESAPAEASAPPAVTEDGGCNASGHGGAEPGILLVALGALLAIGRRRRS